MSYLFSTLEGESFIAFKKDKEILVDHVGYGKTYRLQDLQIDKDPEKDKEIRERILKAFGERHEPTE
jgi:hypothetical protein